MGEMVVRAIVGLFVNEVDVERLEFPTPWPLQNNTIPFADVDVQDGKR
jgi:hypothetical protein